MGAPTSFVVPHETKKTIPLPLGVNFNLKPQVFIVPFPIWLMIAAISATSLVVKLPKINACILYLINYLDNPDCRSWDVGTIGIDKS